MVEEAAGWEGGSRPAALANQAEADLASRPVALANRVAAGSVVAALTEREHAFKVQKKAEKKKDMHFPMHRNAFRALIMY